MVGSSADMRQGDIIILLWKPHSPNFSCKRAHAHAPTSRCHRATAFSALTFMLLAREPAGLRVFEGIFRARRARLRDHAGAPSVEAHRWRTEVAMGRGLKSSRRRLVERP